MQALNDNPVGFKCFLAFPKEKFLCFGIEDSLLFLEVTPKYCESNSVTKYCREHAT